MDEPEKLLAALLQRGCFPYNPWATCSESQTAVGYRTQLGIYLKQNGLHQRAIDVLSRLGVTTGHETIGVEMRRIEQAARLVPLISSRWQALTAVG